MKSKLNILKKTKLFLYDKYCTLFSHLPKEPTFHFVFLQHFIKFIDVYLVKLYIITAQSIQILKKCNWVIKKKQSLKK